MLFKSIGLKTHGSKRHGRKILVHKILNETASNGKTLLTKVVMVLHCFMSVNICPFARQTTRGLYRITLEKKKTRLLMDNCTYQLHWFLIGTTFYKLVKPIHHHVLATEWRMGLMVEIN